MLTGYALPASAALLAFCPLARGMERVTLANGSDFDCVRHEAVGDRVRLYLQPTSANAPLNYVEVAADTVVSVEILPDPPPPAPAKALAVAVANFGEPTPLELNEMLSHAGTAHNIDAELLAAVVHAESGGHAHAISRAGALGLMQLMPGTASAVGVENAFAAADNVEGGTRYLDQMLTRYHNNIALALAAYNAGPGAVDRYHGVPPFRETRAYVSRIIREFNTRKTVLVAKAR